jgi:membrane peptidoglycan carboxypeptidase
LTSTALSKSLAIAALLLGSMVLVACGESAQEKAKAEVCSARADISKQVNTLTGLTVSTISPTEVKTGVEAIANDLSKIKKAQGNLAPARKEQVVTASHTFETQLSSILTGITSNLSLSNAESQFKSAVTQLGTSFKQSLAPINCS